MSLVNDMLNDLDERRSQQRQADVDLKWMTGHHENKADRRYLPLISVSFILLLVAIGYISWNYQSKVTFDAVNKLVETNHSTNQVATVLEENSTVNKKAHSAGQEKTRIITAEKTSKISTGAHSDIADLASDKANESKAVDSTDVTDLVDQEPIKNEVIESSSKTQKATEDNNNVVEIAIAEAESSENILGKTSVDVKKARPLSLQEQDAKLSRLAIEKLRSGFTVEAEGLLKGLLQRQPLAKQSGQVLSSIWLSQRQYDKAEQLLDRLHLEYPQDVNLLKLKGRLLMATQREAAAVNLLMSGRPAINKHSDYYELLALVARKNKQYALSEQVYRGLLEQNSNQGDWWVGLGIALDAQGSINNARNAYRRAVKTRELSVPLGNYARQRLAAIGAH